MKTKEPTRISASPVFEKGVDAWVDDALRRPDSFILWNEDPKMFTTWSMGPVIQHRDSDTIQRSNAKALIEYLESDPSLGGWEVKTCSHWAVGHVDHLTFQVLEKMTKEEQGLVAEHKTPATGYMVPSHPGFKLTRIACIVKKWFDDLADYPVADEDALCELEFEEGLETIKNEAGYACRHTGYDLKNELPDGWECSVHRLIADHMHPGGGGMWVDHEHLFEALKKLDFVQPEE